MSGKVLINREEYIKTANGQGQQLAVVLPYLTGLGNGHHFVAGDPLL